MNTTRPRVPGRIVLTGEMFRPMPHEERTAMMQKVCDKANAERDAALAANKAAVTADMTLLDDQALEAEGQGFDANDKKSFLKP